MLTIDSAAPDDVSSVTTTVQDQLINISWTQPADTDLDGILVVKSKDENIADPDNNFPVFKHTFLDLGLKAGGNSLAGDDLGTTLNSGVIVSTSTNFLTATLSDGVTPLAVGHFVVIRNGVDEGRYEIAEIAPSGNTDQLRLTTTLSTTGSNLTFAVGDDLIVDVRNSTSITETEENGGIINDKTYFYRVYAFDLVPNFSAGVDVAIFPSADFTAPDAVSNIQAAVGDQRVNLTWNDPNIGDFSETLVVRSLTGTTVEQPEKGVELGFEF